MVDLLPDREPATARAWLSLHLEVSVAARDRAGGYAGAIADATPQALQVADRWHLMENASAAILQRRAERPGVDPARPWCRHHRPRPAQRRRAPPAWGYLRRREESAAIRAMAEAGAAIKEIARRRS